MEAPSASTTPFYKHEVGACHPVKLGQPSMLKQLVQRLRRQRLVFSCLPVRATFRPITVIFLPRLFWSKTPALHTNVLAFCKAWRLLLLDIVLDYNKRLTTQFLTFLSFSLPPPSTPTVRTPLRPDNSPASYHYETTVGGALPVISTLQVSETRVCS